MKSHDQHKNAHGSYCQNMHVTSSPSDFCTDFSKEFGADFDVNFNVDLDVDFIADFGRNPPDVTDFFITESKLGLLQYSDARQPKGLLMAPLSPRDVTSCHVELFTFSRQCSQHCLFIC